MARRLGLGGLALLVFSVLFDTLVAPGNTVLGALQSDLSIQFLPWRDFGFSELASGNLALWNPHIYGGAPFFGGMQSALLYPPNWIHLLLPLPLAVNWTIAINLWLLGAFLYLWALKRELSPFAAFVASALAMFCAPTFLRVEAGHLSHLSAMPWTPLLFLAIDGWIDSREWRWCLLGMLATAFQVFAGHPQYLYITAIAAGIYSLARLFEARSSRVVTASGLAAIAVGGGLLAAVQLLAGVQATSETIRALPLPYEFSARFGFPIENLLTLLAPGFFGGLAGHPYWGRWYLWEACGFIGVSGLALSVLGMTWTRVAGRRALLVTLGVSALIALGDDTPAFRLLYDWLPLFDRFRGSGKFMFVAMLLLTLFAGHGLERTLREHTVSRRAMWAYGAAVAALVVVPMTLARADWGTFIRAIHGTGQTYLGAGHYADAGFVGASRAFASLGLFLAALTLAATAALAYWARRDSKAARGLGLLAVAEVLVFATLNRPTFDSTRIVIPEVRAFLGSHPGEYRVLDLSVANAAMSMRAFDVWGYDPGVTRRYAELVGWTQGTDPARVTQYVTFSRIHPLLSMVRLKYVVQPREGAIEFVSSGAPPLGRIELLGAYQVREGRAAVLQALDAPSFDPRNEVILEDQPDPAPVAGPARGRAEIVREGTDFLEIEADLRVASILLVTDAWAEGWRVRSLAGGDSGPYRLMPANYALRAIPLRAGKHRLRLEYSPLLFRIGAALSGLAWFGWIAAVLIARRRPRRASG